MNDIKTTVFSNGLLWFGAGISIAEILTGMLLAPLGFEKGLMAILIGHVIGGAVMVGAGIIGGKTGRSAMETVALSFGHEGSKFFAGLNVIQLIGWTAVMIASAAMAANTILDMGMTTWSVVIGVLIGVWILLGLKNLGKVNVVVMTALFLLTILLSKIIFTGTAPMVGGGDMTMGSAIELAVTMPLSWLPIISTILGRLKSLSKRRSLAAPPTSSLVRGCSSSAWVLLCIRAKTILPSSWFKLDLAWPALSSSSFRQ